MTKKEVIASVNKGKHVIYRNLTETYNVIFDKETNDYYIVNDIFNHKIPINFIFDHNLTIDIIVTGSGNELENDLPNFMLESNLIDHCKPIDDFVSKKIENFKEKFKEKYS